MMMGGWMGIIIKERIMFDIEMLLLALVESLTVTTTTTNNKTTTQAEESPRERRLRF
jgi:uncharacterized membrane protein